MKTLAKYFSISALVALSFISNANTDTNTPNKASNFAIGVYQTQKTLKMNLLLEKVIGKKVIIYLKDEKGNLLHTETVAKATPSYRGQFDMSELTDGTYTFEITDGNETLVKQVKLQSKEVETSRKMTFNK